jgi:glutaryl-CoA dehydrogenase
MASKTDVFQSPDYYLVDELLSDEHKLIRETVRAYVKKEISPIIEEYTSGFSGVIVKRLGIWLFWTDHRRPMAVVDLTISVTD